MGNTCCKRQKFKYEKENDELQIENESQSIEHEFVGTEIEQHQIDPEEAQRASENETKNIELHLNDVYEKECVLKAPDKEVEFKFKKQNDILKLENESQKVELKFVGNEIEQNLVNAEVTHRSREDETNNLELYLNDVYEKECVLKASEEETEFIQTGIETLVQKIVDLVIEDCLPDLEIGWDRIKTECLVKAYFNINKRDNFPQVKIARSEIINVGSFYEGTKNNFPNEFDFIFLLFHVQERKFDTLTYPRYMYLYSSIVKVTKNNKQSLMFKSNEQSTVTRKLCFDQYLQEHGPASMLQFIYINSSGDRRNIHVDLVPAVRITPFNMEECLKMDHFHMCFKNEIMSKETCLTVADIYSFTETEVYFMRNVLSEKHRTVYRILKILINGHDDGEIFKLVFDDNHISSFDIKLRMIEHHYKCQNPHTDNIRGCVINILELIFQVIYNYGSNDLLIQRIDKLILILRIKQTTIGPYIYDKFRLKSVSRQCLDDIDRNDSEYAFWFKYLDTLGEDNPGMDSFEQFLNAEIPGWRQNAEPLRDQFSQLKNL